MGISFAKRQSLLILCLTWLFVIRVFELENDCMITTPKNANEMPTKTIFEKYFIYNWKFTIYYQVGLKLIFTYTRNNKTSAITLHRIFHRIFIPFILLAFFIILIKSCESRVSVTFLNSSRWILELIS